MAELRITPVREAERAGVPKTTTGYVLTGPGARDADQRGAGHECSPYPGIPPSDTHRPSRRRTDKRIIGGSGRVNVTASLI
jgi:hypothetical protein